LLETWEAADSFLGATAPKTMRPIDIASLLVLLETWEAADSFLHVNTCNQTKSLDVARLLGWVETWEAADSFLCAVAHKTMRFKKKRAAQIERLSF
jgi:hypothetical protein